MSGSCIVVDVDYPQFLSQDVSPVSLSSFTHTHTHTQSCTYTTPRQQPQPTMHKSSLFILLLVGPLLEFQVEGLPIDTTEFMQTGSIEAQTMPRTHLQNIDLGIHLDFSSE